ncbi:MAG: long-chain fatty acid--CoA ligase [Deltaproteobacteria bacterium]|nr:long-chain fatty acid--CoA ligase [Deltaproteobacteria bacterium]MBW2179005.1 long-chain fatty acid--CoA ligase [Deltaproteobacteria bacterium]
MNLVELSDQNYEEFGEVVSVYYNDEPYTNVQLRNSANSLANGLIGLGIKPGDKVLVMLLNSPDVLISYGGILRAGAVIIPVIFLLGPNEIAHILKNSEAKALIVAKAFLETINQAKQGIDTLKHVIVVEDEDIPDTIKYTDLIKNNPDTAPDINIKDDDMAVTLYTSGTTGVPKGVMLTHKNLYSNAVSTSQVNDPEPDEVGLFILPLSHSFGLTVMNVGMMFPNKGVLMPWFDLEEACKLIEKYKINGFAGVPAMYAMFLNSPDIVDKYDLSSLKRCASGSAPLPVEVLKGFEEKFDCVVLEGYGLSEAAPVVTAHYVDRERKPGSIGQVIPGVEIKVVDENDNEVPTGEIGELIVKGPNVSPGYYKLKEETEKTFKNGWLYTGDIAKMDDDGYVFIVDRKKDLIIRGGFNIVPRDVEEVLYTFPPVLEAAVVGVPDQTMGEEIKAFVVLREDDKGKVTEKDVIEHCQKSLAKYKTPKFVEFIDALPRNPIGKVKRKELRETSS